MGLALILILCVWAIYYFAAQRTVTRITESIRVDVDEFTSWTTDERLLASSGPYEAECSASTSEEVGDAP